MARTANDKPVAVSTQSSSTMTLTQKSHSRADETQTAIPICRKVVCRLQALRRCERAPKRSFASLPEPSQERLHASLDDVPLDTKALGSSIAPAHEKTTTVLYLAYGSNLCKETFRGARGIRPLSQVNVLVPSLRLTFDLPGVPYAEPCFANTAKRSPVAISATEQEGRVIEGSDYHKDRWHKGLVGVVYEVTLSDYAHIIATEGGGSSYNDILVDCYVLPTGDTVPPSPTSAPFRAHTLFAPIQDDDGNTQSTDRVIRPDPSYAQPSARYLKLITDGAAECNLPAEYRDYLSSIRTYEITSQRQNIGKAIFLATWMPFIMLIFALSRTLQDKKGRAPWWFAKLSAWVFVGMWMSYDSMFKGSFGDGERTMADDTRMLHNPDRSNSTASMLRPSIEGEVDFNYAQVAREKCSKSWCNNV